MWQRFTHRARAAIFYSQEEAGRLGDNLVTPEHMLLGLTRDEDPSSALRSLKAIGIEPAAIRDEVERIVERGEGKPDQDMSLTTDAKQCIDGAYEQARQLNDNYIGTEHLLLGLLCQTESPSAQILKKLGADLESVSRGILQIRSDDKNEKERNRMTVDLKGRDILSIGDLSAEELKKIFETATELKARSLSEQSENPVLPGQTLAMIFEKPSLRTRVTFDAGMFQLGGYAVVLQPSDIRMGERESVKDVAMNLERWVQCIMARVFSHQTVLDLAKYAKVPVINGLSDLEHPCQALADFLTIQEHKGELSGLKLAYIGDGCNTCNSLMLLAAKMGTHMSVGCPEGYEPDAAVTAAAQEFAKETGAHISIVNDPFEAVKDADVIYTDVWTSMGMEAEKEKRMPIFRPFQVNQKLVDAAAEGVIVMHCLPAHRGEEITDEVLDGPHSVALDEAENRLHAQKAVLALVM